MSNNLKSEKSPYLKQHENNPVNWFPWNNESLNQAKIEKKPIFLSVGYASCHWCHVMAHESFEDEETAKIMNEKFINIKVDREERPDLDYVFQKSLSILTGTQGGWPLSMFLDENGVPFTGGTYFPPKEMHGRPDFRKVLNNVSEVYQNNREKIIAQAVQMQNIFSKINQRTAVLDQALLPFVDKIISYCDGLMVARGDLGVEIPPAEVPLIQKELVKRAKKARIPVIIATQMMESMINSLTATRAEVNDVANSVMDGADAVMLSGETSVGEYPVEVIKSMSSIILSVENSDLISVPQKPPNIRTVRFITKSICYHAVHIANDVQAKAICTLTNSGYTAFQVSAWRPNSFILVFTPNKRILTQLNLIWGVKAFFYNSFESTDKTVEQINQIAKNKGYVNNGDLLVNLTAMPIIKKGMVNTLRVSTI